MSTTSPVINVQQEQGTVAWFDSAKGYGFITRDNGMPDAYVHYTAILVWNGNGSDDKYRRLMPGERVEFEVVPGVLCKPAAKKVRVIA